jgi:hypothetical protein
MLGRVLAEARVFASDDLGRAEAGQVLRSSFGVGPQDQDRELAAQAG